MTASISSTSSTSSSRRTRVLVGLGLLAVVACGGGVSTIDGVSSSSGSSGTSSSSGGGSSSSGGGSSGTNTSSGTSPTSTTTTNPTTTTTTTTGKIPKNHRVAPKTCDNVRPSIDPNVPDAGPPNPNGYVSCYQHSECIQGNNGRCVGNGHDGWHCTYDACVSDDECKNGAGICECEGGFRSDNNACLVGNCHVDKDCGGGTGYCSPTLGSCGHYTKSTGYYCHTPQDECVDDDDCGGGGQFGQKPYCKYEETVGHWKCSTQECAG